MSKSKEDNTGLQQRTCNLCFFTLFFADKDTGATLMDKHHILVVDDNHINRLFFQSSLKKLNTRVSLAESGFEAVKICRQHSFDLILMDIRMDGMDGIEAAQIIKALEIHRNTPILAVSAERFEFEKHSTFKNSLLKPISQQDLKLIVDSYLTDRTKDLVIFDEKSALKISHEDQNIVKKLRKLLIQQLADEWQQINYLFNNQNWSDLDNILHKLLGSARICAASLLINHIKKIKTQIKNNQQNQIDLQQLKYAIDQTIQFDAVDN